ncbi:putative recombination initiation protein NBS1 [Trypanosoma vivax]|nr:putative recombination initiation protein NBS1 [Trypanosoma vivax]
MHIIEVNFGGGELHRCLLLPGITYTVGRKECRILLPSGDPSISRHHASIVVKPMHPRALTDLKALPGEVSLCDTSKHGTLLNGEPIGHGNSCFVYADDHIKFGKKVTARILPLRIVVVESAQLVGDDSEALRCTASMLGALLLREATPSLDVFFEARLNCSAFLYITYNGYTVTPGTLLAQQRGYHITTLKYLQSLATAVYDDCAKGLAELPVPPIAQPGNDRFPVSEYMRPSKIFYDMCDFLLNKPLPNKMLRRYTFLLPDVELKNKYEALLQHCGALIVLVSRENASMLHSRKPDITSVVLASNKMFTELQQRLGTFNRAADTWLGEREVKENTNCGCSGNGEVSHADGAFCEYLGVDAYITLYNSGFCIVPEHNVMRAAFTGNYLEINGKVSVLCLVRTEETTAAFSPTNSGICNADSTDGARQKPVASGAATGLSGTRALKELEMNVGRQVDSVKLSGDMSDVKAVSSLSRYSVNNSSNHNTSNAVYHNGEGSENNDWVVDDMREPSGGKLERDPREDGSPDREDLAAWIDAVNQAISGQGECGSALAEANTAGWDKPSFVVHAAEQVRHPSLKTSSTRTRVAAHKVTATDTLHASPANAEGGSATLLERQDTLYCRYQQSRWNVSTLARSISPLRGKCATFRPSARQRRGLFGVATAPSNALNLERTNSANSPPLHSLPETSECCTPRGEVNSGRSMEKRIFKQRNQALPGDKKHEAKSARATSSAAHSSAVAMQRCDSNTAHLSRFVPGSSRDVLMQRGESVRGDRSASLFSNRALGNNTSGVVTSQRQDIVLRRRCEEFQRKFLDPFSREVESVCRLIVKQGYLDAGSSKTLENGMRRLVEFLAFIQRTEMMIIPSESTDATRSVTLNVRRRSVILRRRIKEAYQAVKAGVPERLNQLREVLSARPMCT